MASVGFQNIEYRRQQKVSHVSNQIFWCTLGSDQDGLAIQTDSNGYVEALWCNWMQRWTVPIEVPNLTASWRRLAPPIAYASEMDRRASWFRYVCGGRPIRLPFSRALHIPALTRSTIKLRSNSSPAP